MGLFDFAQLTLGRLPEVKTFHSAGLELFNGLAEELKAKKEDPDPG